VGGVGDRAKAVLARAEIGKLIAALVGRNYEVIGPVVRDGAIVFDRVERVEDLPAGWTDEQEAGRYRLKRRDDDALFGYAVGPHSWKNFLHPPVIRLWTADRQNGTLRLAGQPEKPKKRYAFLGARSCDLSAIAVQDRVLMGDRFRDPIYGDRRDGVFIVAVQCTQSAATCFCTSMETGPMARTGFDLALTELGHEFLVEVGSPAGAEVLAELQSSPASDDLRQRADAAVQAAAAQQTRHVETKGIKEMLYATLEHPRWDQVAERCLTCGNCTMVCPTCFCTTVEDATDVTGEHAERWRKWDSCFTTAHSYIHGGSVRASGRSRYRQWLTHKLGTWIDQFGTSGCVGCGRCIAWCPVGIDITEEVQALRET
jgi:ferredoxin